MRSSEPFEWRAPQVPCKIERVTYRVPLWVRALLATDHLAARAANVRAGLRDELMLAWIDPADRAALSGALYARQSTYLPGGEVFQRGLSAWERSALDSPLFPRSGRVLVGAAGGGREVVALVERGFEVVAFDPCAEYAEAARRVAPSAEVFQASYDDLVAAASGRGGPLASVIGASFDAILLGWGSLSHVTPLGSRLALFHALRRLAPRAPVLASFALLPESSAPPDSKGRVRDTLRRVFAAMGAPGISEVGDIFLREGFFAQLASSELMKLASEAGYEVSLFEEEPFPHAVLTPLSLAADSGPS